ncbi:unnamed protein product [Protopolystoma xenopodis]|uniref:SH3 domain-containing protein n=1 Tax=Protopolystoma xenopodis TaxID=117903 RepID=A0A448X8J7_9PLAT|nr:unnamed protein product [Protopolystoma xenopodis]
MNTDMEADGLHDFVANAEDELGFSKGSLLKAFLPLGIIILSVEDDPNWYMAEQEGRTGLVPCNYLSLRPHSWYVRNCSRMEAEERLLEIDPGTGQHLQKNGAMLLRQSEAGGKGYSLSVK